MTHASDRDILTKVRKSYEGGYTCTHEQHGLVCGRRHFAKGLCQAHYMRKRRYGDCGPVYVGPPVPRKLTDGKVIYARRRVKDGLWSIREAAEFYGVSYSAMTDAIAGRTFRDLVDPLEKDHQDPEPSHDEIDEVVADEE